jgi:MFS family permease
LETSILRNSLFLRFWLGASTTVFASQMMGVAVGWQIYEITHSTLDLGLVGLAQFAPQLVLTLFAGQAADHWDRRRIAIGCQLTVGLTATVLALTTHTGVITPGVIFACAAVLGAARSFEAPTVQSLLPMITGPRQLAKGVALTGGARNLAVIVGPPLGGLIYVFGANAVYGTTAVCYLTAILIFTFLHLPRVASSREPVTLQSVFGGVAFMLRKPVIFGSITVDLFAVLLHAATGLLPVFASDILRTGPLGLGMLRASPAAGALMVSIFLARHPINRRVGRLMFESVAVFGLATIAFGLSRYLPLSMLTLMVMGAADMVSVIIRTTLVQLETPDNMRGRVAAVNSIFISTSNQLGQFEAGVTATWFGTVPAVMIGGIGTLIVVALGVRLFPALARRDRMQSESPAVVTVG